jgi:hypothetical protein
LDIEEVMFGVIESDRALPVVAIMGNFPGVAEGTRVDQQAIRRE